MKTITMDTIASKGGVHRGIPYVGRTLEGHRADIIPGISIRLHGTEGNVHGGPRAFNMTFRVGEVAVYQSANYDFTGTITAIGPATVTIDKGAAYGRRVARLSIYDFSRLNWDYDAERIAKRWAEMD